MPEPVLRPPVFAAIKALAQRLRLAVLIVYEQHVTLRRDREAIELPLRADLRIEVFFLDLEDRSGYGVRIVRIEGLESLGNRFHLGPRNSPHGFFPVFGS